MCQDEVSALYEKEIVLKPRPKDEVTTNNGFAQKWDRHDRTFFSIVFQKKHITRLHNNKATHREISSFTPLNSMMALPDNLR